MHTTSNEKSYFDLHTSGIGYIQCAREVPVRGGRRAQPFLACKIAALVGSAKDPSYRYFDVKGQAVASLKARLLKAEPLDRAELASVEQHELITRGIGYLSRTMAVPVALRCGDRCYADQGAALCGNGG